MTEQMQKLGEHLSIDYEDSLTFEAGFNAANDINSIKESLIIEYCKPHVEQMWAASIVGFVLDCDFRDAKQAIEKWEKENENTSKSF